MKTIRKFLEKLGYIVRPAYSEKCTSAILKTEKITTYINIEIKANGYYVEVSEAMKNSVRTKKVVLNGYKKVIDYIKTV